MGLDHRISVKDRSGELLKEYWFRKVNCLQGYMEVKYKVENCVDEIMTFDDICYLNDVAIKILESRSIELGKVLLPIQTGFFYGNYEYNEFYFDDIATVLGATSDILENFNEKDHHLVYWCWY
ncbi:hypothetical protein [Erysipelothrix aquatica]|uniref:hypothetical protein n=1 Tax=Erysipelothrix aquatica TaxID=2683714 RepID=UPI0013593D30|nr:hypothetical protein [Erysipelothrix aquatica]